MASSPTKGQHTGVFNPGEKINMLRTRENDKKALGKAGAAAKAFREGGMKETGFQVPQVSVDMAPSLPKGKLLDAQEDSISPRVNYGEYPVIFLSEDIANIKTKPAAEIADDGKIVSSETCGALTESFSVSGRSVVRMTFREVDEGNQTYGSLTICRQYENRVSNEMGTRAQPPLDVEQWLAASIILATGGEIGARGDNFWSRARDLARQQMWRDESLEARTRASIDSQSDKTLAQNDRVFFSVLALARDCIPSATFNPYYQARRDSFANEHGIYTRVDADVFMALDKHGNVIAFSIKKAYRDLLPDWPHAQNRILWEFDTHRILPPVRSPDKLRNGLHWADWIGRLRPDLDPLKNPLSADPSTRNAAKSGTYAIGMQSATPDPDSSYEPCEVLDLACRGGTGAHEQLQHVRFRMLGSCTVVADFYLDLLDPELRKDYVRVSNALHKHHSRAKELTFTTRPGDEPFAFRTVGINMKRYEEDPESRGAWEHGLTAYTPLGYYEGGDLMLRELGVQVACPQGSMQLIRSEVRHSITAYTGTRVEICQQTPEGVRRWTQERMTDSEKLPWGGAAGGQIPFQWTLAGPEDEPADDQQQKPDKGKALSKNPHSDEEFYSNRINVDESIPYDFNIDNAMGNLSFGDDDFYLPSGFLSYDEQQKKTAEEREAYRHANSAGTSAQDSEDEIDEMMEMKEVEEFDFITGRPAEKKRARVLKWLGNYEHGAAENEYARTEPSDVYAPSEVDMPSSSEPY